MISWPPLVPYKKLTHSRYSVLGVAALPSSPLFCSTFVIMLGGLFDLDAEEVKDKSLNTFVCVQLGNYFYLSAINSEGIT